VDNVIQSIVVTLALALFGAVCGAILDFLNKHKDEKRFALGLEIARVVVMAVEQVARATGYGSIEKLTVATDKARALSQSYGLHLSEEQWQVLIEKAVYELHQFAQAIAPSVFLPGTVETAEPLPSNVTPLPTNT
jgi:hypothetical protein